MTDIVNNVDLLSRFRECLSHSQDYITLPQGGSYYYERDGSTLKLFFEWS